MRYPMSVSSVEPFPAPAVALRCPLCDAAAGKHAFTARDRNREVSDARFTYRRCDRCGTLFLADVPVDLDRYYPADYLRPPAPDRLDDLALGERPKLDLIKPLATGGRLVEVGPGEGLFARLAANSGFDVTVVERDGAACTRIREEIGVHAIQSAAPEEVLPELPPSRVVALWHVIEHVPEPGRLLAMIAANLEPGGVLAVATPNPQALGFRLQGARWAHVDAPRHLALLPLDALLAHSRRLRLRPAVVTLDDPGGLHWNRFAWERALRRHPGSGPAPPLLALAAAVLSRGLRPVERRGRNGAAYTVILVKDG